MDHAACTVPPCAMPNGAFAMHQATCTMHHVPYPVYQALAMYQTTFIMQHAPCTMQCAWCKILNTTLAAHQSSYVMYHVLCTVHNK